MCTPIEDRKGFTIPGVPDADEEPPIIGFSSPELKLLRWDRERKALSRDGSPQR